MKKICTVVLVGLMTPLLLFSQPLKNRAPYDITKDTVLYVIGYSHLDTEWLWDYPNTIDEFIKNIMTENFHLFEKYPDYVFNFTGSRRYRMMKEYYPELYKKVVGYIKQGRWYVSGSSVDEGEVNVSSSESVIRQVLYGNNYFRKEFGAESKDYMLPDCFGFLGSMPSVWAHCGLLGFSTQKLTWHSAVGIPFNVGIWKGPDDKGVIAALNVSGYTGHIIPRLDKDNSWNIRLASNAAHGYSFDYSYYGVGDKGGAPRERDVKNAVASLNNSDSKFRVVLASSDQMYKDITPEIRAKLPTYKGDLLLIEHSAGSLTSQAYMKRMNRKNELLAQSAEQLASAADLFGGAPYPGTKLNDAWDLLLGSQFHDILPGTSIPRAYEFAWNDEFIAANGFSGVLKNSARVLSSGLNTQGEGRIIVVYNPVAADREDIVPADLEYSNLPENIEVIDKNGKSLPVQIIERKDGHLKFIFLGNVPSVGMAVFDVRESNIKPVQSSLKVTSRSIENEYYKVKIADNGDILSVFDKKASREVLSKPARLEFLFEHPSDYPAWNMDWKDRQNPPIDFLDKNASISIIENGPVRVALQVKREGRNSVITQVLSLADGKAGEKLEITNKIDWQSREVSLKASFPLIASNADATYNLGVGTIERGNNDPKKFEVPSREWFDLTDKSGRFGVSILEDCKYGSDKPDDRTLRLTLLYTPKAVAANNFFRFQGTQDWGIHDIRYGLYSHAGDWRKGGSPWQAKFFNQPLMAFETPKHDGSLGKEISLLKTSSPQIGLMAFKKMEENDYYLIRVNELYGQDGRKFSVHLPLNIVDAYEVNGQEQRIGDASFRGNTLNFDLSHYTIRSFAVKFATPVVALAKPTQIQLALPFNEDAFSFDDNRDDGRFTRDYSYPAELYPKEIVSEGIRFNTGNTSDGKNNILSCKAQTLIIPEGNNKLYILAAATSDVKAELFIDGRPFPLSVQLGAGFVGQFYNRNLINDMSDVANFREPFTKRDNIAWFASHRHIAYPSKNDSYQYCYIFKYGINLPQGAKTITLPENSRIKVFAITAANDPAGDIEALMPLYDDFKNTPPVQVRN